MAIATERNLAEAADRSTPLQRDILRTLIYFDLFRHPLTVDEIYAFLPSNSTTPQTVLRECCSPPLNDLLVHDGRYFRFGHSDDPALNDRPRKERRAARYIRMAAVVAFILRRCPYVRGVFVSGELSKGVASKNADIDFFIVTAEGRLWICRTLLTILKKTVFLNQRKFFCINHLVTEHHLAFDVRNYYSAVEAVTLIPLYNTDLYRECLQQNSWIDDVLPNARASALLRDGPHHRQSRIQRMAEAWLPSFLADRLESWLLSLWQRLWKRRYRLLPDDLRDRLYRSTSYVSTAYGQDHLTRILTAYRLRLTETHLKPG